MPDPTYTVDHEISQACASKFRDECTNRLIKNNALLLNEANPRKKKNSIAK